MNFWICFALYAVLVTVVVVSACLYTGSTKLDDFDKRD